jgi:cytochrome c-type biogenesis protein CcsB
MNKLKNILFSLHLTLICFVLLGIGAGVGTIIENDYGSSTARVLIYNSVWYEFVMILIIVNLIGIMVIRKMYKTRAKFIFHSAFIVILIGAGITRYFGYEGIMHIRELEKTNKMISLEPYLQVSIYDKNKVYYKEYQKELSALGNKLDYKIDFADKQLRIKYNDYMYAKKGKADMGILKVDVSIGEKSYFIKLVGKRGMQGVGKDLDFGGTKVHIEYGSKSLTLPFSIKLDDFVLNRYPGSMSPSSYSSYVSLIDEVDNVKFDYHIFMNHILHYKSYQFFQSSYDQDEKGTILSVNNDPGKWPTYFGYFMLLIGLIMNLFDKKSRFAKLTRYLKQINVAVVISILFVFSSINAIADTNMQMPDIDKQELSKYLIKFQKESLQTAEEFGHLVVQAQGRMKPVNSLNLELLHKISGKNSLFGMNADQIILGMITNPQMWRSVKMIKIKTPKLKQELGIKKEDKFISFSDTFDENEKYKLEELVNEANKIAPRKRGTFEKDIIRVDERLNIIYMIYYGNLFNIYPYKDIDNMNNKWLNPINAMEKLKGKTQEFIELTTRGFISSVANEDYNMSKLYIGYIKTYQEKVGHKMMLSDSMIENEILFNKINLFPKITLAYVLSGILLFILSFIAVFKTNFITTKKVNIIFIYLASLFALHTFGMAVRWYLSGHAPWSNVYESLLYISWSSMFAGIIFFRKSLMALSATVVIAGIFMFVAHLSDNDPQITTLVPVLKSYWLTIHVSIITGSYGFLGIGAILGFMALILFIFRNENNTNIDKNIYHIVAISEVALIIGLSMLTVGNFLGGVWANESWGRYWGWDAKETWAYVSIVVYAFILHLRLIKSFDRPFIFASASLLAFASILMTYFGVNYYLSGMHSYATGDPVPVPTWAYVVIGMIFIVISIAWKKRDLSKNSLKNSLKN